MELETRLITRVRSGDREALAEFVRRYEPLIRARFRERFDSTSREMFDSSDFFATVLRRFDSILATRERGLAPGPESPADMLGRIMLAAASDYSRVLHAERAASLLGPARTASSGLAFPREDPDTAALEAAAAAGLDGIDGQILRLRSQGAEHQIVADALGMSASAIRMRWCRIRTRLREMVRAEGA